jgi:hypothetical protein
MRSNDATLLELLVIAACLILLAGMWAWGMK